MNDVVERLRKSGTNIEDAWLRRMGPGHFGHINFRGLPSSTTTAAVAKNRFITRHKRQAVIPPSSPTLTMSGVDSRHFDGVTGSPRSTR